MAKPRHWMRRGRALRMVRNVCTWAEEGSGWKQKRRGSRTRFIARCVGGAGTCFPPFAPLGNLGASACAFRWKAPGNLVCRERLWCWEFLTLQATEGDYDLRRWQA